MRFFFCLAPVALLVACATPQQQCLNSVTQELRVNAYLIAQTQANLNRGYAIDKQQRLRRGFDRCSARRSDGTITTRLCPATQVRTVNVPQAINLTIEQDTLNQLLATRDNLERQATAATDQCRALYPQ